MDPLRLACPSCGAENALRNPGIVVVVCPYCQTTLYREEGVLRAGQRSIVGQPASNLAVGSTGQVAGQAVTLVGRVRFEHARGAWDEWYGTAADGSEVWLTEDEKAYTLDRALKVPMDALASVRAGLAVGDTLELGDRRFQVDEVGQARCVGGEGQLPRDIRPGQAYRFADLTEVGGRVQLGFEWGETGGVLGFLGRDVPPHQVEFAPPEGREHAGETEQLAAIRCPNCGASFTPPRQGDPVRTAVCQHCDSILALEGAAARVAGHNPERHRFLLEIGDSGKLLGKEYEVVGRMLYREGLWPYSEFLLWSEKHGYAWLEESDGNFVLLRPTAQGPALAELRALHRKERIEIAGTRFQFMGFKHATLEYVDGALPWLAVVGDQQRHCELIAPPQLYAVELSSDGQGGAEMERFIGQHIDHREVYAAFEKRTFYPPTEAGAAQPNPMGGTWRGVGWLCTAFTFINLGLASATMTTGQELAAVTLDVPGGEQEVEAESLPFAVPADAAVLGVHVTGGVDNSWVYVTSELLQDGAEGELSVGAVGSEVSYYHGYEDGESWEEGSRSSSRFLKPPPPGQYTLAAAAESDLPTTARVTITTGDRLTRYPLGLALLLLIPPLIIFAKWRSFERDRWDEEEDD